MIEARIFSMIREGDYRAVWSIARRLDMTVDDVLDIVIASPLFWIVTGKGNWKYKDQRFYLVKRAVP